MSATLGRDDARYQVWAANSTLRAQNPAQALAAEFTRQGIKVSSGRRQWQMDLRAYGYGHDLRRISESAPTASRNRVEYRRPGVLEWYANGPAGLEQGFAFSAPPGKKANGEPLTLVLALQGSLTASVEAASPNLLSVRDGSGQTVLRYAGLEAGLRGSDVLAALLDPESSFC